MTENEEIKKEPNPISVRLVSVLKSLGYDLDKKGVIKELQQSLGYERPDNIYNATKGNREPGIKLLIDLSNMFDKFPVGWIVTGKNDTEKNQNFDLFEVKTNDEKETKEIVRLRAVTNILLNYVLELRAGYYNRPLENPVNGVVDEYETDLTEQLLQLRTEQL